MPDVLSAVFEQLTNDHRTLYAAARVSRTWAALALDELWREPPESAFAGVASPARRSFYAAKVLALAVWRYNELLRPLAFPLLRTLRLIPPGAHGSVTATAVSASRSAPASIDNQELRGDRRSGDSSDSDKGLYEQYFGPRLERLSVKLDTEIVQLLLERRPHLRELDIIGVENEHDSHSIYDEDINMDDYDTEEDVLDDDDEEFNENVDEDEIEEVAVTASRTSDHVPNSGILGQTGNEEEASKMEQEDTEREDDDSEAVAASSVDGIRKHISDLQHGRQKALPVSASDQRRVLELYLGSNDAGGVIEYVRLRGMAPSVTDDALVRLLAPHETLMALELCSHMPTPSLLETVSTQVPHPFRALRRLKLDLASAVIPALVRLIPAVEALALAVREPLSAADDIDWDELDDRAAAVIADSEEGLHFPFGATPIGVDAEGDLILSGFDGGRVLSTVAEAATAGGALPRLRALDVAFMQYTQLPAAELLALRPLGARLRQLQLHYAGYQESLVRVVGCTPDVFRAFAAPLGELRVLRLGVGADVAPRSLRDVGLACPQLRVLEMPDMRYDLDVLAREPGDESCPPTPVFPNLERLEVTTFDAERRLPYE
jgi:hypothetical protein